MKLCEINPFVRYALPMRLFENAEAVSSYDCRLFYVLSGNAELVINGRKDSIREGDALLWQSGTEYKFIIEKPIKIIAVNFDYTQKNKNIKGSLSPVAVLKFNRTRILENVFFEDAEALNNPLKASDIPELKDKLKKITDIYSKKEMYYSERCSALIKDVIIDMLQNALFTSSTVLGKIEKVIGYIERNYSNNITNSDIAAIINYHPYYLNKLMIKYTNLTLHKYLLNFRIEKAREYLLNKKYSIYTISEKCGFSSPGHFSNAFKQKYGCSPKDYRESHRNLL